MVITAIGGLIVGLVGGWFTFVRDNTKRLDDRDLAILKHQANRVDAQMDRYEKEILYLRERQSRDSQRIDQLMLELDLANKRIDELEHENAALRGL